MFRTSIINLQERFYAVCCNLVCLDTSCCYEGEGRTAVLPSILQNDTRSIQYQTSLRIPILFLLHTFKYYPPVCA